MRKGKNETGIVAACHEIIDRGHGKANQPISGPNDAPLVVEIVLFADQKPKDWQPREYQLPSTRSLSEAQTKVLHRTGAICAPISRKYGVQAT